MRTRTEGSLKLDASHPSFTVLLSHYTGVAFVNLSVADIYQKFLSDFLVFLLRVIKEMNRVLM